MNLAQLIDYLRADAEFQANPDQVERGPRKGSGICAISIWNISLAYLLT